MLEPLPIDQRLTAGLAGMLRLAPVDQEGTALELVGPVTVSAVDHTGTTIIDAADATEGDGAWTSPVQPADTADLARWTCTWTDTDTGSTWTTYVEIAGGHLYTVADVQGSDPTMADQTPEEIARVRLVVEAEAEWICAVAFTRRLAVVTVDGVDTPSIELGVNAARTLRSLTVDGVTASIDSLTLDPDGQLWNPNGWAIGRRSVVAAIEHGLDRPAPDMRDALLVRHRTLAMRPDSQVPLDAVQWEPESGGAYRLDRASRYRTGIPDVDAVYFRHSRRAGDADDKPAPASRPWDYDPSNGSIFHQGRR